MSATEPVRPDDETVAEYVLGTLPHGERVAFEARLREDAPLRRAVADWSNRLAPLADDIEPVEPPAAVLANIESALFGPTAGPAPFWQRLGVWRGLAIASLAGMVIFAGLYAQTLRPDDPATPLIATVSGDESAVRLAALYEPETRTLRLNRRAGAPEPDRAFELWLIAGDAAPVSLGVLPSSTGFTVDVPEALAGRIGDGAVLAVSDEPSGGSPTGQPTGAVLATGEITAL